MKFDVAQGEKHHTEKAISFETPHEKQLFLSPVALFFLDILLDVSLTSSKISQMSCFNFKLK